MIYIDVPQIAYKTWGIEVILRDENGNRDFLAEKEFEDNLQEKLFNYPYSSIHDHVR